MPQPAPTPHAPAMLVLEDGRTFRGDSFGADGETFGEAVFATAMTGYQETFTDPSYHRQVIVMTAPHIGNTGVNDEDDESRRIWVAGYVVRDPARVPSNWRSVRSLDDELRDQGVVGISDVDTRALTRHLRERGAMRVGISSTETDPDALLARVREQAPMSGADLSGQVTTHEAYVVPAAGREALQRRRRRPRHQGEHPADDERPRDRGARAARDREHRRRARGPARRSLLLERPRRPRHRRRPGRTAARRARRPNPVLRHLLRQPAARSGPGLRHLQAALRPPRDQPARDGPDHRQGRDHLAEPRLRRRRSAGGQHANPVRRGDGVARVPQRRRRRGSGAPRRRREPDGVQRPVPPGGRGRAARRRVPLRPVLPADVLDSRRSLALTCSASGPAREA